MFRTSNPALKRGAFSEHARIIDEAHTMTIQGTINKIGILFVFLFLTAGWTWHVFSTRGVPAVMPYLVVGVIGGLIFALITIFKRSWAPFTAPVYAALEGLVIGGLSAILEAEFEGIVLQAVGLTFGVLVAMFFIYKARIIKVTGKFITGVLIATGGVFLMYLATFVLGLFGVRMPYIHEGGTVGILISAGIIIIASLNLLLDFHLIEKGAERGAPKQMEWYGAFALIVTMIWLYIEILRLLSMIRSR